MLKKLVILLALVLVFLAGCTQTANNENPAPENNNANGNGLISQEVIPMKIVEVGDTIKVEYRGTFEDGTEFDASANRGVPLEFVAGAGQMIKGFDEAVIGMKLNQEKTVALPPEKAYGSSETSTHPLAGKTLIFWIKVVDISKK